MKTMICSILISLQLLTYGAITSSAMPTKYDPEDGFHQYIKWADIARKAVGSKYPEASAVDFLYVGCKAGSPTFTQFVYKFWMSKGNREFAVYVTIDADKKSGRAVVSKTEKTDVLIPSYGKWRRIGSARI